MIASYSLIDLLLLLVIGAVWAIGLIVYLWRKSKQ